MFRKKKPADTREGAAMFVVLLVIMMGTATAAFAVHSSSSELKGVGFARQRMQAGMVAESALVASYEWVDHVGPKTISNLMRRMESGGGEGYVPFEFKNGFPEPALSEGKALYRLSPFTFKEMTKTLPDDSQLIQFDILPVNKESSVGSRSAYEPFYLVDLYDNYAFTRPIAGMRSDGRGQFEFLAITMTSRGRLRLPDADDDGEPDDVKVGDDPLGFNESMRDARAYTITGPYQP